MPSAFFRSYMKNTSFESLLNNTRIHIDDKEKAFANDRFCQMKDNAKSAFKKSQKADFSDLSTQDIISKDIFSKDIPKKSLSTKKALCNSKNHNEEYFITNKVFD